VPSDYGLRPPAENLADALAAAAWLAPAEKQRVAAFKAQKRQVEWIAGRLALKALAVAVLFPATPLARVTIHQDPLGAPFLPSAPPGCCVSLSHSHERVVAGLTIGGRRLGIDIEKIAPLRLSAIARIAFSPRERSEAAACTPAEIFHRWVIKEAFLKLLGKGFHEPLHQVEVLGDAILHRGIPVQRLGRSTRQSGGYAFAALWRHAPGGEPSGRQTAGSGRDGGPPGGG
jgi:4'-phosphopantetheinyl transferase